MSDKITADLRMGGQFPEGIEDCWRCPKCGSSRGIGNGAKMVPPVICAVLHPPTEMEQITPDGMKADWPSAGSDGEDR